MEKYHLYTEVNIVDGQRDYSSVSAEPEVNNCFTCSVINRVIIGDTTR